jgi:hypothetical protein
MEAKSVGVFAGDWKERGHREDIEIEENRPIMNVIESVLSAPDIFFKRIDVKSL